ncbi:MAG: aminotransferase class III-fold pyridoxal phosphate-dependent enzyme, partial [Deltaproteobacteria bacterium]|nr:aminotransferase class III-fold pyridoxal phosphate-dependent enzyme [Deltaproteobacteria bacterium]
PISAVVGRKELMKEMEEVFFSFTFGGETLSIAAAIATIQKLMKESVIQSLWDKGQVIMDGVFRIIQKQDLGGVIQVRGKQPWSLLDIRDHEKFTSWEIKSLIKQEMLRRGILISVSHNLSYSHSSEDLETLLRSYDEVMGLLRKALDNGNLPELLIGNPIEPIFKVR